MILKICDMFPPLSRLPHCQERWRSIRVAPFSAVFNSRIQQFLCELRFVNTVHVRLRFTLDLSTEGLIADPTVNQRSVISESTFSRVCICSSFRAFGGFEIEVMVDINHSKPTINVRFVQTLEEKKKVLDCLV